MPSVASCDCASPQLIRWPLNDDLGGYPQVGIDSLMLDGLVLKGSAASNKESHSCNDCQSCHAYDKDPKASGVRLFRRETCSLSGHTYQRGIVPYRRLRATYDIFHVKRYSDSSINPHNTVYFLGRFQFPQSPAVISCSGSIWRGPEIGSQYR